MKIPIVMVAFGTRGAAKATYDQIDRLVRKAFPGHEVHWAFSSRIVRQLESLKGGPTLPGPDQVLSDLHAAGHRWAVIQSTHFLCGHEFHTMLRHAANAPLRTSAGLPLLTDPQDLDQIADLLAAIGAADEGTATVFVGHGTDHPSWMAYPLLQSMLHQRGARRTFVGVLEGRPGVDDILATLKKGAFTRVRLLPLLLVAGNHFIRDLSGEDSQCWQGRLEAAGLAVEAVAQGIGLRPEIGALLCRHVAAALDVIPSCE